MIFVEKNFLYYALLTDQISLSVRLYLLRYWLIRVLWFCLPVYDVFKFENNLSFLIKLFFSTAKTPRQKFEYLQDKNKFKVNLKAVFIIFKGLLVARNWLRPLSGPLKVHSPHAGIFLFNNTLLYFWLSNEIFFCWTRSTQCDNTYLNKVWPEFCVTFFICVRLMKVSSNIRKLRRSRS